MKKLLIIGSDIAIGAQIEKLFKEKNLYTVVNNSMRKKYLENFEDLEPISKLSKTKFHEKPKSKYHK